jgi:hypothetical protein
MIIKRHIVLPTGLHCIIDKKNHVHVFTEAEYLHITWWSRVKRKLFKR